jgi:hypothetical protein
MNVNPFESFSHSLVASKLWLCEKLENTIDNESIKNPVVNILASWDSLLAFMMNVRRPNYYSVFNTYDMDSESVNNATKICDHWRFEEPKIFTNIADINTLDFSNIEVESVFINCSIDQIEGTSWYDVIPVGSLVCLQCTNLPVTHTDWEITQGYTLEEFMKTYHMSRFIYTGTKTITYPHFTFDRHMLIGIK